MVSERAQRSKRPKPAGFVDFSQIDISEEDELEYPNSNPRRMQLTLRPPKRPSASKLRLRQEKEMNLRETASTSEESSSEEYSDKRTKVKQRAGRPAAKVHYNDDLPSNDSESDSYGSNGRPRLGKRKRATSRDVAITRRSDRAGRTLISMRERAEDDIPEFNTRNSSASAPKAVGAKESFRGLPKGNEFRDIHCMVCDTCKERGDNSEKGPLVFCQGCTFSHHQICLGPRNSRDHLVTKVGNGDFVVQCRRCVDHVVKKEVTAPRQSKCQVCRDSGKSREPFRARKTAKDEQKEREENDGEDPIFDVTSELLYNAQNVMFRCVQCFQAFHMHHLPPKSDKGTVLAHNEERDAQDRFAEYSQTWKCHDCETAPAKIGALIAWRPIDTETYQSSQMLDQICEDDKEYLIKWDGKSYYKSTWKRGAWVYGITHASMRIAFARKNNGMNLPKMLAQDAIPEDYLRVDIVFSVRYTNVVTARIKEVDLARVTEVESALVKFKGLGYEDVVWEEPPDQQDTERWNDFRAAYEDWVIGHYIHLPVTKNLELHLKKISGHNFATKIELKEQPKTLIGGKLMDYQMDGLNWLLYQWHRRQNAILADEMGLGKTIQVIAFLSTLQQQHGCWPFLVVVPNSTIANWRREIKQWAPSLRVVAYFGSKEARDLAYKHELFPGRAGDLKCHVVITSYDAAENADCQRFFRRINWAALIVDEGQRLKNDKNLLYAALGALKAPFKILLTGTPLQNNQRELFNLLQFLDESVDAQALGIQYETLTKENVPELHELLRPFFLRRTKVQVLTFLPAMAQIIVPVTMSGLQKQLYKSILAKNSDLLRSIFGGDRKKQVTGLRNLLMQLRKCLCHPFVYSIEIEERSTNEIISHRRLVEASSKLQLLEVMLPKLQERGHRVLIFSQFLTMLTIIEDFMDGLGLKHSRLDGTMGSMEKQKVIDEYNAPESQVFALLLSTKAGGVGINLASADTVIILDPDFNPHTDLQAISRAHRIGQKRKVLVFQMMTRGSAEEKILQIGKKKMALDHVLIEQMEADEANADDLESVLRFGAEALFKDDGTHDIHYDSISVDKLLDRSQIEDTKAGKDSSAESQFSFARVWANETGTIEDGLGNGSDDDTNPHDPSIWENILAERARQAAEDRALHAETLGRGKRQRQAIDYTKQGMTILPADGREIQYAESTDSDADFGSRGDDSEADDTGREDNGFIDLNELHGPEPRHSAPKGLAAPAHAHTPQPLASQTNAHADSVQQLASRRAANADFPQPLGSQLLQDHTPLTIADNGLRAPEAKQKKKRSGPKSGNFRRVTVEVAQVDKAAFTGQAEVTRVCLACMNAHGLHKIGWCPLKIAGVEFCNLCKIAHYASAGLCPKRAHMHQLDFLIADLKSSPEDSALIKEALAVCNEAKADLVAKEISERAAKGAARQKAINQIIATRLPDGTNTMYIGKDDRAHQIATGTNSASGLTWSNPNGNTQSTHPRYGEPGFRPLHRGTSTFKGQIAPPGHYFPVFTDEDRARNPSGVAWAESRIRAYAEDEARYATNLPLGPHAPSQPEVRQDQHPWLQEFRPMTSFDPSPSSRPLPPTVRHSITPAQTSRPNLAPTDALPRSAPAASRHPQEPAQGGPGRNEDEPIIL